MFNELPINITDLVILAILLISGLLALGRGFVKEVLAIGGWIIALIAALEFFPVLQPIVHRYIEQSLIADFIAGVVIFIVVLTIASFVSTAISRRVQRSEIGILDRSLGFLFGLMRGLILCSLAYLIALQFLTREEQPYWLHNARAIPVLEYSAKILGQLAPKEIRNGLDGLGGVAEEKRQRLNSVLDKAINTGKLAKRLKGAKSVLNEDAVKRAESGYTSGSRQDMEQLIQNQNKK